MTTDDMLAAQPPGYSRGSGRHARGDRSHITPWEEMVVAANDAMSQSVTAQPLTLRNVGNSCGRTLTVTLPPRETMRHDPD